MMSKIKTTPNLTIETATSILGKILDEIKLTSILQQLEDAKNSAGNEMLKVMQHIFPIVMQIQMRVIKEYGFPHNREGIVKFAQIIRSLEKEDAEIARLHSLIKTYYLPPVSVNATNESTMDDEIISSN